MADFWDGLTGDWNAYANCTCAGGYNVIRSGGHYEFSNTYGSQWTGPNFDNADRRPGIEANHTYVLEVRAKEVNSIKTNKRISNP